MSLGMRVMISQLSGNSDTVTALRRSVGKTIAAVSADDDKLSFTFSDGDALSIYDAGQSCCESRYLTCGDLADGKDKSFYIDATILDVEVRDAPSVTDNEYEEHEVQFLLVTTSKGVITAETHNEHNGYYGGFAIEARYVEAAP